MITNMKKTDLIKDWAFRRMHKGNLVYNTCWEDPRCDRQLLQLESDSRVVMITSAGCNALEYLLDDPARIHCVDVNYRQNALLELKLAALQFLDHSDLFRLFGEGRHPQAEALYRDLLRPQLPPYAQRYWDRKIYYFSGKGKRGSFYYYGTSGSFAWMAGRYLQLRRSLRRQIGQLFAARTIAEQRALYPAIEAQLTGRLVRWILNRHLVMSLVGVPRSQQELFMQKYEQGALGYIQECLRQVFCERPLHDNYFWRVYLEGAYQPACCPAYLEPDNQPVLRARVDRIHTHSTTLADFLREHPGPYSHFVLLDHQDWLAANDPEGLKEEWRLILKNSRPGTRILLRSAAAEVDFFPDLVRERVQFDRELAALSQSADRVGTYASTYLGIVS